MADQAGGVTGPSPAKEYETVVVWFRRDLRVDDNPALLAALQAATNVVSRPGAQSVRMWKGQEESWHGMAGN